MPRPTPSESPEAIAGMEVFYTDTPGLGGKLRFFAEDFVVDEVGGRPREVPEGKHVAALVRLTNWEQNHFVRDAARKLGIGRKTIGFSGTKDKRAVTTQWFTFVTRRTPEEVADALSRMNRVEVLESFRTDKGARLGQHDGNGFTITVRGLEADATTARNVLDEVVASLAELGGLPNYFGIQRFGIIRPITHIVGRHIIHGDIEAAVMAYLTELPERHDEAMGGPRTRLAEDRDWKRAQDDFPRDLRFERAMIQHLSKHPDDWVGALRQLPNNLVVLFVHAYQSWLFNRVVSERIRRGLPLAKPLIGDLVLPLARGIVPTDVEPVVVTERNEAKVREQVARGRALVGGTLIGSGSIRAAGEPREIEAAVFDSEGITPEHFVNTVLPEATSSGTYRAFLVPVEGLEAEVYTESDAPAPTVTEEAQEALDSSHRNAPPAGPVAILRFALPKGAYATCLLREVMKAEDASVY